MNTTRIKIVSNPYNTHISFCIYKEQTDTWENIRQDSVNSRLRENDEEKIFLPFNVNEMIDTIIKEYYVGTGKIELIFEGTADEYEEVANICNDDYFHDKVHLTRSARVLENARDILEHAKEIFDTVHPIIKFIVKDDTAVTKGWKKYLMR